MNRCPSTPGTVEGFEVCLVTQSGVIEQATEHVTVQVLGLLEALAAGPHSTSALMQHFGLTHRPNFLSRYLYPAQEAGLVKMTIPDKPRSRKQRYKLTAAGEATHARRTKQDGGTE